MTNCECPLAGYCKRHKVSKPSGWHQLCQTNESYFQAWEQGRGPGQAGRNPKQEARKPKQQRQPNETKEARRLAVLKAVRLKKELVEWLTAQRIDGEKGVGDTAVRLVAEPIEQQEQVLRLIKMASCRTCDGTDRLNRDYPYTDKLVVGILNEES